ncbi:16S rRNA (adenine(1518)-N(6)/adenine(1519)-N(6))-dimethyltransferase RsmA [Buchnera aphidicola]|uniref:Ribosomal RNA small subunit methyltransferase A n=1 Tax=Buchnera aphidicola (Sarucallis kahawaluokalani) TaxID=1241878 RepID=A0A4D6YJ52_9GAMM|nr:16S rRNA (adenine(1518)-N(6)/adenine(1519)-N(6))-dimethyltransferase RsmA [Buchnera aphidicola]QCI25900.1 16S rRNA (adenine(1518)-N(6)/adenine(1519)-N(6))-dimethyltransferase RsmA [Buchnera aphidicola (Sarucallis kahawaluokalani)]
MNRILQGYIPKKYLGQNFLQDRDIINKIINLINPKKEDSLVEIGPGLSALTEPMCNILDNLIVIEVDCDILNLLKRCIFYNKLYIFNSNVINFDFKKLSIQRNNALRIFGNIPYNISVQLILYLIQFREYILDIHFMLQKEVADRLVALPGNKKYGRLSIITQSYYDINIEFIIPPDAFFPIPKIYSSFVTITPKVFPLCAWEKMHILKEITFFAFRHRRKILKNSLLHYISKKFLINLNINPNLRAENISVKEYCKIVDIIYSLKKYNK